MKKLYNWLDNYLTNCGSFSRTDSVYRKAYILNATLTIMLIVCILLFAFNLFLLGAYISAGSNMLAFFSALFTLLYFKKTNNYRAAAYMTVAILVIGLGFYFFTTQNRHYSFYWLAVLPPISYFLLERKAARIILLVFGAYMMCFFIFSGRDWGVAEFGSRSVFNITFATVCLSVIISVYEESRNEAWNELNKTILQLEKSESDLKLILNSSAEAIYGIDLNGNCTFCNRSCLEMLGYKDQSELLGKNMHLQIHHSRRDGSAFPAGECSVYKAITEGEGSHADDEVFWRADGTSFDVEYFSYPQIRDGKVTGAVVTFMDISKRRQKEAEIQYLNCYDILTGLHNRRCFEENRDKIDIPGNLPLSVIFADINGLKMTNDIFGHIAGDELIKKSAEILKQVCRQNDIVARIGGDEFIILLPNTTEEEAGIILERIRAGFTNEHIEAVKCSISLGFETKRAPEQSLDEILANAENAMYRDKTINRKLINKDIIDTIIETLHFKNPKEKEHSASVSELSCEMGKALKLPETEISKLKRAAYLHDIGKIVIDEKVLAKDVLLDEDKEIMRQHTVVGYRILSLFDDTLDLAEYVYGHHERWDGAGYPRGLKGEQIPLISRIIHVAETYDRILRRGNLPLEEGKKKALDILKSRAGAQHDPKIVELFIQMNSD